MVQPLRAGELGHALIGPIPSRHTIAFRERVVATIFRLGGHHFVKFPYKPMLTGVLSGLLYFALIICVLFCF